MGSTTADARALVTALRSAYAATPIKLKVKLSFLFVFNHKLLHRIRCFFSPFFLLRKLFFCSRSLCISYAYMLNSSSEMGRGRYFFLSNCTSSFPDFRVMIDLWTGRGSSVFMIVWEDPQKLLTCAGSVWTLQIIDLYVVFSLSTVLVQVSFFRILFVYAKELNT